MGKTYLRCQNFNPIDTNTVTEIYYQIGAFSRKSVTCLQLIVRIADVKIFHKLRTEEQLCYYVGTKYWCTYNILGYSTMLQSQESKFSAEFIDERIEKFQHDLVSIIKNLSDEDFKCFVDSIDLYDDDVSVNSDDDDDDDEEDKIGTITKAVLLDFYVKNIKENDRKLCCQVIGHSDADQLDTEKCEKSSNFDWNFDKLKFVNFKNAKPGVYLIENVEEFKSTLEKY